VVVLAWLRVLLPILFNYLLNLYYELRLLRTDIFEKTLVMWFLFIFKIFILKFEILKWWNQLLILCHWKIFSRSFIMASNLSHFCCLRACACLFLQCRAVSLRKYQLNIWTKLALNTWILCPCDGFILPKSLRASIAHVQGLIVSDLFLSNVIFVET